MATRMRVDSDPTPTPKPPATKATSRGVQQYTAPAYGTNPQAARPFEFTVGPAPTSSIDMGGGGGGGGGVGAAMAAAPVQPPSFDQFISGDFGYNQTRQENERRLNDFDAETLRGRQTTEADQNLRRTALQQVLQDAGGDWASDSANRGLLRSGLYQQGQDRFVDQRGVQGNQDIDQLLTDFIQQRGTGRVDQEAQGRSALNDVLSQLSQRYNQQYVTSGALQ